MALEITKLFQFISNRDTSSIDLSVQTNRNKLNAIIGTAAGGASLTKFRPNAASNSLTNLLSLNNYLAISNTTNYTLGTGNLQPTPTPFIFPPTSTPSAPPPTPATISSTRARGPMMAYGNNKIVIGAYPDNLNIYLLNNILYHFSRPTAFITSDNGANFSKIYLPDPDNRLWNFTPSYVMSTPCNTINGTFFENGKFFLFPGSNTTLGWENRTGSRFYTSTDGVTWTTNYWPTNIRIAMSGSVFNDGFAYGNGTYVLIPYQIEPYQVANTPFPKFLTITSNDGVNWTRNEIDLNSSAYSNLIFDSLRNRFVVLRTGGFYTSTDGVNWSILAANNYGDRSRLLYYRVGSQSWIYFITGNTGFYNGVDVYMSTDGGANFQLLSNLISPTDYTTIRGANLYVNPSTLNRYLAISVEKYTLTSTPYNTSILTNDSGLYVLKNSTPTKIENSVSFLASWANAYMTKGVFEGMTVNNNSGTLYYPYKEDTDPQVDGFGVQYYFRSHVFN